MYPPKWMKSTLIDFNQSASSSGKQLRPNMYVNESLTKTRSTIMYALRRAKMQYPDRISGSGSVEGKVAVWVKPLNPTAPGPMRNTNTRMFINSRQKLEKFCVDILGVPVSTFVDNWL